MNFEFWQCSAEDQKLFASLIGDLERTPDLIISDDHGEPYLYRWHVIPRNSTCNVYAHIQVASDPARPLHDHPWDNTSVILSGGYFERMTMYPNDPEWAKRALMHKRVRGDLVSRKATFAHRLLLPENIRYTMTLFTSGPKIQEWGFWVDGKKLPWQEVTRQEGNASLWIGPNVEEDRHAPYIL